LDETTTCNAAKEAEPDPGMMQSIEEHQQNPKEDATVMLVGGPRKRRRVCNLAVKRHQNMRERTRGNMDPGGSQLPPEGRCPALQKWHGEKKNLSRKIRTLEKCGRQKEFAASRIRTRCTKLAWRNERSYEGSSAEQERQKNKTRNNIARGT
jgi:hypothetical protein